MNDQSVEKMLLVNELIFLQKDSSRKSLDTIRDSMVQMVDNLDLEDKEDEYKEIERLFGEDGLAEQAVQKISVPLIEGSFTVEELQYMIKQLKDPMSKRITAKYTDLMPVIIQQTLDFLQEYTSSEEAN